jgi:hypothetical protein
MVQSPRPRRHVHVDYFPGTGLARHVIQPMLDHLKSSYGHKIELYSTTSVEGDPDHTWMRGAFGIHHLPAFVISKPWPVLSVNDPALHMEMPPYCVVDDPRVFREDQGIWSVLESLVLVFAAAKSSEIATALRTRRFRILVWNAAAHLDEQMAYISSIDVRFVVGASSVALRFDAEGWSVDDDRTIEGPSAYRGAYLAQLQSRAESAEEISDMIGEGGPAPVAAVSSR